MTAAQHSFRHWALHLPCYLTTKPRKVHLALWIGLALCWATPATAQSSFELPAPQLQLQLELSASASSTGPVEQFRAFTVHTSTAGSAQLPLLPGEVYTLQRSGELHQIYNFDGPDNSSGGFADLFYSGHVDGRAGFGNLGVAASMAQTGRGYRYEAGSWGQSSGPGSGTSAAESRSIAVDSFTVLSVARPIGTAVVVDFGVEVSGTVSSAAVEAGVSPFAIGSLAVTRQVQVFRPGNLLPVFSETRDFVWQAGHEESGGETAVSARLPWLLALQVGDEVSLRLTLTAGVTNQGGIPPGGDVRGEAIFDASAHVSAMNSAHASLVADAPDIRLIAASGYHYSASPVPEPSPDWLWCGALAALLLRHNGLQVRRLQRLPPWWPGLVAAGLSVLKRSP